MGVRRDDITSEQRAQMAIEVLSQERAWGKVSELAQTYAVSRKTIYDIAAKGKQVLLAGLQPGPHGPTLSDKLIRVERNRLVRGSVVLTEVGVSQRDVTLCLSELLDTAVSSSWVNAVLAQVEGVAAAVNQAWQPQFASDGGTGLAAGAKAAEIEVHQLDWDHLLRPLWGQAARLEKQAYAGLHQVEERAALFEQAKSEKRLQQHLSKWEQLTQQATEKMAQFDAFYRIARSVDDWFALIDLPSGQLPDVTTAISQLQAVAEQLQSWSGRIYQKLASNLKNWAPQLFSYHPLLHQALLPLQTRYGPQAIAALARMWQIETDQKRRPCSLLQQLQRHTLWADSLDEAWVLLGEHLWTAWDELGRVLGRSWRGSMLAECVNSLLRPILARRKHTDQGCLELFRLLHNVRPFKRGKRADSSPAQLVGLEVPDDPLLLLGLDPKVLI